MRTSISANLALFAFTVSAMLARSERAVCPLLRVALLHDEGFNLLRGAVVVFHTSLLVGGHYLFRSSGGR